MNKKNQTIYLIRIILIGLSAKCISILSKILMNRFLGVEAMGLFSLINPLVVLLISLSSLSLPSAIATLISKHPNKDKKILISSFVIFLFLSLFLMIITYFLEDIITQKIFKNNDIIYCLRASLLMIPLTSLSAIIKGYFLGKGEVKLTSSSQIFEESGRLLFLLLVLYLTNDISSPIKASFAIFSLACGEIFQINYMLFSSNINKRNILATFKRNIVYAKDEIRPILNISLPLTFSRLIGSVTYFFEPLIFTNTMLKLGASQTQITQDYGILSSYVMPLLFMPSFISVILSNFLLPNMGKMISKNNHKSAINLFYKITFISLFIGFFINSIFFIFSKNILCFLYDEPIGETIMKSLSFPFIIYYIETPIIAALNIYELNKKTLISTIISCITRLVLLSPLISRFGVIGVSYATILSVLVDISFNLFFLFKFFKRKNINFIN